MSVNVCLDLAIFLDVTMSAKTFSQNVIVSNNNLHQMHCHFYMKQSYQQRLNLNHSLNAKTNKTKIQSTDIKRQHITLNHPLMSIHY